MGVQIQGQSAGGNTLTRGLIPRRSKAAGYRSAEHYTAACGLRKMMAIGAEGGNARAVGLCVGCGTGIVGWSVGRGVGRGAANVGREEAGAAYAGEGEVWGARGSGRICLDISGKHLS